jgi:arylsulfatase A-like enzyme
MSFALPKLGGHAYLRRGFRMSATSRRMLLGRYRTAIELMDGKLADFWAAARGAGLLDDTLAIVASDHGEGFGEHGVYLHDASVHETHLQVPLFIHHPEVPPAVVDDVVSTRDLFGLLRAVGEGRGPGGTILDGAYRRAHPVALAEHFHYPHVPDMHPSYRHDLVAAIVGARKVIVRGERVEHFDLEADPDEQAPALQPLAEFAAACRGQGLGARDVDATMASLHRRALEA